jgi:T-complex protein 1 subunit delta
MLVAVYDFADGLVGRMLRLWVLVLFLQVAAANGEVIITNDGATILNKMTVAHPAAKMLVELAKSQVSHGCRSAAVVLGPAAAAVGVLVIQDVMCVYQLPAKGGAKHLVCSAAPHLA